MRSRLIFEFTRISRYFYCGSAIDLRVFSKTFCIRMDDNTINFDLNRLFAHYSSEYEYLVTTGCYHGLELEIVKDIINQLFLDFAEKKIDLDAVSNSRAYIITSFKRRLVDHHRAHRLKHDKEHFIYREISEQAVDRLIEENELSAEMVRKLRVAYHTLPERCKKVIFLKYYEGLSNEEISRRTGLSVRSIYNNLSEGIRMLRTRMNKHHSVESLSAYRTLLLILLLSS